MMVVTLQLEVARRLMAQTDDDDYGILTLLVQLDFLPRGWFKIPPGCFFPAPDVDSAWRHFGTPGTAAAARRIFAPCSTKSSSALFPSDAR